MITLKTLAKKLEDKLNGAMTSDEYSELFSSFMKNTRFEFKIFADEGDYKHAKRNDLGDSVTYYINAILKQGLEDKEASDKNTYSAIITAYLEMVIPHAHLEGSRTVDGAIDSITLGEAVHELVDNTLRYSDVEYIAVDGVTYYVASKYYVAQTGTRDLRQSAGDSLTLYLNVEYAIVTAGIGSEKIEISVDGERLYITRYGLARRSVQDGNVEAKDDNATSVPASKCTTTSTVLTISFDAPVRNGEIDKKIAAYTIGGRVDRLAVTVKCAELGFDEPKEYKMVIAEAGINGEDALVASYSVKLVEDLEVSYDA